MIRAQIKLPHQIKGHWTVIQSSLCNVQWTPNNLIRAIATIYQSSANKDKFDIKQFSGLQSFLSDPFHKAGNPELFWGDSVFSYHKPDPHLKGWFFAHTIPYMAQLILDLPDAFPSGLIFLNEEKTAATQEITLTRHQCATLLACSFFCSFHHTCAPSKKTVNFDNIFLSLNKHCPQNVAKLCMMMNYFERCRLKMYRESEPIVIRRLYSPDLDTFTEAHWTECTSLLTGFKTEPHGSINDSGSEVLHVDFANRWIGGGVLCKGAVQEEIMFCICPELITTVLICGVMGSKEAIVITGADEYSTHRGYGRTLQFTGNAPPATASVTCVAMDATRFTGDKNPLRQYSAACLLREITKARVAFNHDYPSPGSAIATGNWGCGAFAGHVQLKSMLQWLAASSCGRSIIYYTFQDENCRGMQDITELMIEKGVTVGKLFREILGYSSQLERDDDPKNDLFAFLKDQFG